MRRNDDHEVQELAKVVHGKTDGNAFFVLQLIRQLHSSQLIVYSIERGQFEWSLDRILAETAVADSIASIVASKLLSLPEKQRTVLSYAAFLGPSSFRTDVLAFVLVCDADSDLKKTLEASVRDGLLESLGGSGRYKFAHDRNKETFLIGLDDVIKQHRHRDFALQLRLASTSTLFADTEKDDLAVLAATHLNECIDLFDTPSERVDLAIFNLRAAEVAFQKSALSDSSRFLLNGLNLRRKQRRNYRIEVPHFRFPIQVLLLCTSRMNPIDSSRSIRRGSSFRS